MKTLRFRVSKLTAILAAVYGLSFSLTVGAAQGAPIVGLWRDHYQSNVVEHQFETYQQFHNDGLEIEAPDFAPGVCMGTWKQTTQARIVKIFHVGFTNGAGPPGSVRFELRELDTVSQDRHSFDGNYDQTFYDADGNVVLEDMGSIHGTRLSVTQY